MGRHILITKHSTHCIAIIIMCSMFDTLFPYCSVPGMRPWALKYTLTILAHMGAYLGSKFLIQCYTVVYNGVYTMYTCVGMKT